MLKYSKQSSAMARSLAICTGNDAFTAVLQQLLVSWGYDICPATSDPEIVTLVAAGCAEPPANQNLLRIESAAADENDELGLPVDIEVLWQVLERQFHSPPRMHMRLNVDLPARVFLRDEWSETRLSSLSDMGARFDSKGELVRQEPVTLEFDVEGELRRHEGRVIFSMAAHAGDARVFHSGVVFYGLDREARKRLKNCLIRRYLEVVREAMPRHEFRAGLDYFDLAPQLRNALLAGD